MIKKGVVFIVAAALLAAGCTGGPNNAAAMTNETPTAAAMMNETTATPAAMMKDTTPTTEAMMAAATQVEGAMMSTSAPTSEAMMATGGATTQAMMTEGTPSGSGMMESGTSTPDSMMSNSTPGSAMMGSELLGVSMMDVNSGKSFMLSSYAGKVALISMFTTSCKDCLQQQKNLESLNMENHSGLVVVTLDVDPMDSASSLASFAKQNNYHWVFANSTASLNQSISMLYNSQSVNSSTVQTLVVDRMGHVHVLPNGLRSPSQLNQDLTTYLAGQ
ncbi:MAG: redoxin domain-containing protein [Anaerolineaceae bacterium]|nr:redoxin domain-containing protein [Anaerolineaceae bacterium]